MLPGVCPRFIQFLIIPLIGTILVFRHYLGTFAPRLASVYRISVQNALLLPFACGEFALLSVEVGEKRQCAQGGRFRGRAKKEDGENSDECWLRASI